MNPHNFLLEVSQIEMCILSKDYDISNKLDTTQNNNDNLKIITGHFTTSKSTSDEYDNLHSYEITLNLIKRKDEDKINFILLNNNEIQKDNIIIDEKTINKKTIDKLSSAINISSFEELSFANTSSEYENGDVDVINIKINAHKINNDGLLNNDLESFMFVGIVDLSDVIKLNIEKDRLLWSSNPYYNELDSVHREQIINKDGAGYSNFFSHNNIFGFGQNKSILDLNVKSLSDLIKLTRNIIINKDGKSENDILNNYIENNYGYKQPFFFEYLRNCYKTYGEEYFKSFTKSNDNNGENMNMFVNSIINSEENNKELNQDDTLLEEKSEKSKSKNRLK